MVNARHQICTLTAQKFTPANCSWKGGENAQNKQETCPPKLKKFSPPPNSPKKEERKKSDPNKLAPSKKIAPQ